MASCLLSPDYIAQGIAENLHRRVYATMEDAERNVKVIEDLASDRFLARCQCGAVNLTIPIDGFLLSYSRDAVLGHVGLHLDSFTEKVWSHGL